VICPGNGGGRMLRSMALLRRVIGLVLRRARTAQGKTLRDVATSSRVSLQYLSEVERGRKEASSEVLAAICTALGWELVDLLDAVRIELAAEQAETRARVGVGALPATTRPASVPRASLAIAPSVGSGMSAAGQVRLAA
jgi:transcriptional regulator with XRE-family HTH domain